MWIQMKASLMMKKKQTSRSSKKAPRKTYRTRETFESIFPKSKQNEREFEIVR